MEYEKEFISYSYYFNNYGILLYFNLFICFKCRQSWGIELRKGGGDRVEFSQEEVSYLVNEINTLNFKIFNKATENDIDEIGNKGPTAKFRLFVFDKNGN